jgi:hypothetical protein
MAAGADVPRALIRSSLRADARSRDALEHGRRSVTRHADGPAMLLCTWSHIGWVQGLRVVEHSAEMAHV